MEPTTHTDINTAPETTGQDPILALPPAPEEDYTAAAIAKIDAEEKAFKGAWKAEQVKSHVANTLRQFCKSDTRFAEVVVKTVRSLSECCAAVMDGTSNAISDLEVYKKAVQFYFPKADIEFQMLIHTGEMPSAEEMSKPATIKPGTSTPAKTKATAKKSAPKDSGEAKPKNKAAEKKAKQDNVIQLSLFG